MNTLVAFVLCIQAVLIQDVFSQCSNHGSEMMNNVGLGYGSGLSSINPATMSSIGRGAHGYAGGRGGYEEMNEAAYGGAGEGNVGVAGELPVAGNTAIIGQVPILGAVSFGGSLPAMGTVTITGRCSCGCDNY